MTLSDASVRAPAAALAPEWVLDAENVHKHFGGQHVLKGISMRVAKGEVVVIVGPSGGGKSTFLRTINLLEQPDEGTIRVCGELMGHKKVDGRAVELPDSVVSVQRRRIGMVFQQFNLFSHMTAIENITTAPIKVLGAGKAAAMDDARRLLKLVGLPEKETSYPDQLSGGQQQRVAIARALAMHPKLMLFDEPTSALDPEMVSDVLDVMLELSEQGMTMIVVTHEIGFARKAADRAVFIEGGVVVEEEVPDKFFADPSCERTRQFLSKVLHA